ncbi:MAG TPA: hypothetical protein DET40_23820 [Lentisphaeria bacterium]|nr:MAG: hypothetical protein A2X45_24035 [Lentisphaerae bacterium GWF2_50_93]HCE46586.1 hypothetical protein [Lentisphaeria bacterium]
MKAAVVESIGKLSVMDVPVPEPKEYEALCEILYGSTCSGTDNHLLEGRLPFKINYPTIIGHESIGRVTKLGSKARNYRIGDLVTRVGAPGDLKPGLSSNWGGFAEYGIAVDHKAMKDDGIDSSQWSYQRINQVLPADIDVRAATMIITWRETFSYISRMGVGKGDRVLIMGSGGNGLAFASHARNLGASVVVVAGNPERRATAMKAGATHYVDYREQDLAAAIRKAGVEQVDRIIDSVGKKGQADRMLPLLKSGGSFGVYGVDELKSYALNPMGGQGTFTVFNGGYEESEAHESVLKFMKEGKLDASIWLDMEKVFTLDQIADALKAVRERKFVKALVKAK